MLKVKIKYDIKPIQKSYDRLFSDKSTVIDSVYNKIMKDIKKYIPHDTGKLKQSMVYRRGQGIEWNTPYATYVYIGKTKSGRNMKYQTGKSKMAGPRWTHRYLADNEAVLSKYATNVFNKNIK